MVDCIGKPFTSHELWTCLLTYLKPTEISNVSSNNYQKENEEMVDKLKTFFVRDNQNTYNNLSEAIKSKDLDRAHRIVHSFKSNAGMIKETKLQDIAISIEKSLKSGAVDSKLMMALENELNIVLEKLKPRLENTILPTPEKKLSKSQIKELIEQLKIMLEDRNPECVNLLDDIRTLSGSETLAVLIEEYDFGSASTELDGIKDDWMK